MIAAEGDSLEVYQWVFNRMLDWQEQKFALDLARRFVVRLIEEKREPAALDLIQQCRAAVADVRGVARDRGEAQRIRALDRPAEARRGARGRSGLERRRVARRSLRRDTGRQSACTDPVIKRAPRPYVRYSQSQRTDITTGLGTPTRK